MANVIEKIRAFSSSCQSLGSFNWKGFPGVPKLFHAAIPYNRHNFNTFITWIGRLQIPQPNCIIDIGANHGDFSAAASTCFPQANVILFEPLPSLQNELVTRAGFNPKWIVDTRAVGATLNRLPLHLPVGQDDIASLSGFSSSYENSTGKHSAHSTLECDVVPLDQALAELEINHVNLIKIDVEGFEFEVLKGAQKTLERTDALIIELSLIRQQQKGSELVSEMIGKLEHLNFRIVDVIPSLYSSMYPWMPVEYNILARKI